MGWGFMRCHPGLEPGSRLAVRLIFTIMVLTACTAHTPAPVYNGWKSWSGRRSQYIVQKGDTLYSIAFAFNHPGDEMVIVADEVLVKCPSRYEGNPPTAHPKNEPQASL